MREWKAKLIIAQREAEKASTIRRAANERAQWNMTSKFSSRRRFHFLSEVRLPILVTKNRTTNTIANSSAESVSVPVLTFNMPRMPCNANNTNRIKSYGNKHNKAVTERDSLAKLGKLTVLIRPFPDRPTANSNLSDAHFDTCMRPKLFHRNFRRMPTPVLLQLYCTMWLN